MVNNLGWSGLLGLNTSATVSTVEETGAPEGNHGPMASNRQTFTHTGKGIPSSTLWGVSQTITDHLVSGGHSVPFLWVFVKM